MDESDHKTWEEVFRRDFFYPLMDTAYASLQERFKELEAFKSTYGFLCGVQCMKEAQDSKTLEAHCADFASGPGECDVDASDLEREITSFVGFALEKNLRNLSAIQSLNYIYQHSLIDLYYPNTAIALRLLTTLPVTVASCERSFSKLKLIKTYQRSTMAQERLVGVSVISIEHDICRLRAC